MPPADACPDDDGRRVELAAASRLLRRGRHLHDPVKVAVSPEALTATPAEKSGTPLYV